MSSFGIILLMILDFACGDLWATCREAYRNGKLYFRSEAQKSRRNSTNRLK